jgi:hypothetical protein
MSPREFLEKRPSETQTGLGLAASIYGFLTQAGVSPTTAALVAVAIAFVPTGISEVVDIGFAAGRSKRAVERAFGMSGRDDLAAIAERCLPAVVS